MTTAMAKYTLQDFDNIIFNGFEYTVPDNVLEIISKLAMQVGSPDYIKTPVFPKREKASVKDLNKDKKRKGKATEIVNDEDWEAIRNFQPTKIETDDNGVDNIRSLINKLTDKNYAELSLKIINQYEQINSNDEDDQIEIINSDIFDIVSSNRYYSKIYAQLYHDLAKKFPFIADKRVNNLNHFNELNRFTKLFENIEYVDPNENYDKFCEINKQNEKRKALASFYVNIMRFGIISNEEIMKLTRNLLEKLYQFISMDNKKNEVDELSEIIAILYQKDLYEDDEGDDYDLIEGFTIYEVIEKIANSKVKEYKSLTNKTVFKFMDLMDM